MEGASRTAASLVTSDVYDTSRRCGFVMALSIVVDAERKPKFLPPLEIAATECATERPYTLPENVRGHPFEYPRSAIAPAIALRRSARLYGGFPTAPLMAMKEHTETRSFASESKKMRSHVSNGLNSLGPITILDW